MKLVDLARLWLGRENLECVPVSTRKRLLEHLVDDLLTKRPVLKDSWPKLDSSASE
jgi:hypothetical protein